MRKNVMDGNYGGTLEPRLARYDTVVFLDRSRLLCLWRVVRRKLAYHGRSRPDMAPGCVERIPWVTSALSCYARTPRSDGSSTRSR